MPIQTIVDNTYYIFDSGASALSWPSNAKAAQLRIEILNTSAALNFQTVAGTPFLMWSLRTVSAGSTANVIPSNYVVPLGGVRFPTAWIPTTLTACSAWVDFL